MKLQIACLCKSQELIFLYCVFIPDPHKEKNRLFRVMGLARKFNPTDNVSSTILCRSYEESLGRTRFYLWLGWGRRRWRTINSHIEFEIVVHCSNLFIFFDYLVKRFDSYVLLFSSLFMSFYLCYYTSS